MTFHDFADLCRTRHSVRFFTHDPVEEETVRSLLSLAHLAPSVENMQPWHFHVIYNTDLRKNMMDAVCYGDFIEGAGVFILVTCNTALRPPANDILWNPRELEYSCVAAMEHILLGATAKGLAGSWVSLHHGTAHELLSLPRTEIVVGGLMLGHPRPPEAAELPARARHPLEESITVHA